MGSQKVSYNWRSEHRQTWTWLLIQVYSLKLETTKVSFNKGMSKQTMMHSFMAYYSAMKKMEQLIHVTVCIALRAFSSVQFRRSVVSDSLQPHEPQHTRPPCPSPSPGVHSNSRPLSRWCHYATWKNSIKKGHILYVSISIAFLIWQNHEHGTQISGGECGPDYKRIAWKISLIKIK